MLTKGKLADIIAGLAFEKISERVLKQAQDELILRGFEGDLRYVKLAFHKRWAEICLSN